MFESKNLYIYEPYNNINPTIYDWKTYNTTGEHADSTFRTNEHNLIEMKFNLTDVTLKGTENHINQMTEVINRLQVRLNKKQMEIDAFEHCMNKDASCRKVLDDSQSSLYNGVHS